jgi:hypothetical protein
VLKIPFLASYYLISFFPFALDDLQIIKANVAFLLLLPLFFKAIVPLTFCLLSPIAPNVFLILLAVLVVSAILLTFITLYSSSSSTSLLSLLILSLVAN